MRPHAFAEYDRNDFIPFVLSAESGGHTLSVADTALGQKRACPCLLQVACTGDTTGSCMFRSIKETTMFLHVE